MSITTEQRKRLRQACIEWTNTPYVSGQALAGEDGGTDCVRLCDSILQATFDLSLPPLPRHAQDAAFHSKDVVQDMVRHFFERFNLFVVNEPLTFEPADLVMVRQIVSGSVMPSSPSGHHVILVGHRKPFCIDAWPGVGVRQISTGTILSSFKILKIYRSRLCNAAQ